LVDAKTTGHALTREGIDVRIWCCETVREGLQNDHIRFSHDPSGEITTVMSMLFGDLGHGQQFTFSVVPAGSFPT